MARPVFATLRDLDRLGVSPEALATIPSPHKLAVLKAATGKLAPYLRKRYRLPLRVESDDLDLTGVTGTGTVMASGTPTKAQDVTITFLSPGTVGAPGLAYAITIDGITGPTMTLPLSGVVVVDHVTVTFAGTFNDNDVIAYTTGVDWGVRQAVVDVACFVLLKNRGVDGVTEADLKDRHDGALTWVKDLAKGEDAELEPDEDATPNVSEMGPLGTGQKDPWDFIDKGYG